MIVRIQLSVLVGNTADAAELEAWLANQIQIRAIEEIDPLATTSKADGIYAVNWHGFADLNSKAQNFLTDIEDRATKGPAKDKILDGTIVYWHECRHDEDQPDCSMAVGAQFQKGNTA